MKLGKFWSLMVFAGIFLLGMTWQASRFADLKAQARRLETAQMGWISQNKKIEADLAMLSSRERTAQLAGKMGLRQALPEERLKIQLIPAPAETSTRNSVSPLGSVSKVASGKAGTHD